MWFDVVEVCTTEIPGVSAGVLGPPTSAPSRLLAAGLVALSGAVAGGLAGAVREVVVGGVRGRALCREGTRQGGQGSVTSRSITFRHSRTKIPMQCNPSKKKNGYMYKLFYFYFYTIYTKWYTCINYFIFILFILNGIHVCNINLLILFMVDCCNLYVVFPVFLPVYICCLIV